MAPIRANPLCGRSGPLGGRSARAGPLCRSASSAAALRSRAAALRAGPVCELCGRSAAALRPHGWSRAGPLCGWSAGLRLVCRSRAGPLAVRPVCGRSASSARAGPVCGRSRDGPVSEFTFETIRLFAAALRALRGTDRAGPLCELCGRFACSSGVYGRRSRKNRGPPRGKVKDVIGLSISDEQSELLSIGSIAF